MTNHDKAAQETILRMAETSIVVQMERLARLLPDNNILGALDNLTKARRKILAYASKKDIRLKTQMKER